MSKLIDADELLDSLLKHFGVDLAYYGEDLQYVQEAIENAPTVFDPEDVKAFLAGEWVESGKVQKMLGMSFKECFSEFEFSRVANWWSIVGKTEEERQREGQKVETFFKLKGGAEDGEQ